MMRAIPLILILLVVAPAATGEAPPDHKLSRDWETTFQRIGICGWWESYERRNTYNPMSYQWRNRLAAICPAGNGMMDIVSWGRDVEPERRVKPIRQPRIKTILDRGASCEDLYDDGDRCG